MIVWSVIIAGLLSFVVWAHHQFVSGMDPSLAFPFSLMTILISVPFAVHIFAFIATLWRGSIRFNSAMLFACGFLAMFLIGGVTGIMNGSAAADIYVHDSYFVVAHFHYTLVPITIFATFAGIYFWYPKMFGTMMNELLGKLHFLGTFVFLNVTFLPQFNLGMMGHHRRIANPQAFDFLSTAEALQLQELSTIGTYGLLLSQIPFVYNFFASMVRGEKASRNPWQATTLEWNTESPPPHGNFDSAQQAYRGPYVYSPEGVEEDFIPQFLPPTTEGN
jgi:cytochrome c oxidase subunit 1